MKAVLPCAFVCVMAPSRPLPATPEGSRADDIAQAAEQLNQRWVGFCALLAERLAWLVFQAKVHTNTHTIMHVHPCLCAVIHLSLLSYLLLSAHCAVFEAISITPWWSASV